MNNKIDFVVLWVDGEDSKWLEERAKYYNGEVNQTKASAFRDWGTLKYWFRAVEKFAPWVNKVHFVTCGQVPSWLNTENPKINIVNHKDFIPEECLPTFSANSIELNINKIPGLEEQFVYFNDDTFIMDYITENDFFINGLPCDSAIMSATIPSVKNEIFTYILFNDLLLLNANFDKRACLKGNLSKWLSLKYGKKVLKNLYFLPLGKFSGFDNMHLPNAYLKSVLDEVWNKEYDILNETVHRRFRTMRDVNQYIFRYWQLASGKFMPRKTNIGKCFVIGNDDKEIKNAIESSKYKLICLNDNPNTIDFEKEQKYISLLFDSVLSEKSSFEK